MLGKIEGKMRRGPQKMSLLDGILNSVDLREIVKDTLREIVKDREAWRVVVHEVAKTWTRLHN